MPGQDITEKYESDKEMVRKKFEQNHDLIEKDPTKLVLEIIEEASGVKLPITKDDIPSVGTITRASRDLRKNDGYDQYVSEQTKEAREKAEKEMRQHFSDSSQEDDRIIWG